MHSVAAASGSERLCRKTLCLPVGFRRVRTLRRRQGFVGTTRCFSPTAWPRLRGRLCRIESDRSRRSRFNRGNERVERALVRLFVAVDEEAQQRIAARQDQHFGSADFACADRVVQRAVRWNEAAVGRNEERRARFGERLRAGIDSGEVEIDRLFAEKVIGLMPISTLPVNRAERRTRPARGAVVRASESGCRECRVRRPHPRWRRRRR